MYINISQKLFLHEIFQTKSFFFFTILIATSPRPWKGSKTVHISRPRDLDNNSVSSDVSRVRSASEGRPSNTSFSSSSHSRMRSYEDDLDYALEKDIVIKGPDRKVLVGTDNYSQLYSDKKSSMEESQPYHTRYDSKPFSYIR